MTRTYNRLPGENPGIHAVTSLKQRGPPREELQEFRSCRIRERSFSSNNPETKGRLYPELPCNRPPSASCYSNLHARPAVGCS
jgi:hypothetical protein